ncbi:type I-B CRISPR-associated protein Cas8b/Csh1 [Halorussus pelagicus]|uniref:type I-B CRISPR-associated protein Cas8b/Csh1 n=1 Tax=Halorussus pelagicus TaxID=2505977 RepID=UPI000FFBA60F|nr:type I-B CRISPR-associated protein Cas8b/Csh1 [Halorussus pelagicus]
MVETDALSEVDPERIEAALPDRPVTSLRDIEALYGELYALAELGSDEYAKYRTPDAAATLLGMDQSVLVVRLDLRGETPAFDEEDSVEVQMYRDDLVPMLAHSKYASARGVDHSLTHQSGRDNSAEKLAVHATDRFTRWPTEDAVRETAERHEDGWLLDVLADLGEDDEMMDTLEATAESEVPPEATMLVTVRVALDADDEASVAKTETYDSAAEYHYPGEFEVFQEAMAARKTRKFKAKNEAKDAVGDGVCFVSDTEESVYGVVDDPMKSYLSKQAEKFPRFDSDESWRTQPLSRDAAIAAQNAETFLDACQYSGSRGVSVYYLPYLRKTPNAETAQRLFELLAALDGSDGDETRTPIERAYEDYPASRDALRYFVLVVHKYQKDRWRLVAGSGDVSAAETSKLGEAHRNVLNGPTFGPERAFPTVESWGLLDASRTGPQYTGLVSEPSYFFRTCAETDEDDPSADDLRFRATVAAISGESIRVESLLESYVERIGDEFDASDGLRGYPDRLVASQYAQLAALADRGVLDASRETTEPLENFLQMTDEPDADEQSRIEALDDFIDRHPAIERKEDDKADNHERRGVFLLGALVGRLTQHQRYKGKSMTAVKRHPVDGLTKHNVVRTATEVVDLNHTYWSEGDRSRIRNELADRLSDDLQYEMAGDWTLTTEDLRFHYAMGIAYGLNDTSNEDYNDD